MTPRIHLVTVVAVLVMMLQAAVLWAQPGILVSSSEPQYITPCGPSATFSYTLTNQTISVVSNAQFELQLPGGVEYVPGSLSVTSVVETDISDLNSPVFTVLLLQAGTSLNFSIELRATCETLDNTSVNINEVTLYTPLDTIVYESSPYNINLPAITTLNSVNFDYFGAVGEIYTRGVSLVNSGFGPITELYIQDVFNGSGAMLLGVTPGTLQMVGDTAFIHLDADDFMMIGDGDGLLEQGEGIQLFEELEILNCVPSNSFMTIGWGCDSVMCQSTFLDGQVSVLTDLPFMSWSFGTVTAPSMCEPGMVEVLITNDGNGGAAGIATAYSLILEAGWGEEGPGYIPGKDSCLSMANFQIGGVPLIVDSTYSGFGLNMEQFAVDPDGPGGLSDLDGDGFFDDLANGDTIVLTLESFVDPFCFYNGCFVELLGNSFKLRHFLDNQCGLSFVDQHVDDDYFFSVTPATVINNVEEQYEGFEYFDLSFDFIRIINNLNCFDDEMFVHFLLPPSVEFSDLTLPTFEGNPIPYSVSGDTLSLTLDNYFGEIEFQIHTLCDTTSTGNPNDNPCSTSSPLPTVSQIEYWAEYYCNPGCTEPVTFYCGTTEPFFVRCDDDLDEPPEGVAAGPFTATRVTLGWTDSTLVTQVDPDINSFQSTYVMAFDTVRFEITGGVFGVNTYDTTSFYFYYFNGEDDPDFEYLYDTLHFYDFETDTWIDCPNITPSLVLSTDGIHLMQFEMLPLLEPGGCLDGYHLTGGDLIYCDVYALVNNFINPGGIQQIENLQSSFVFNYEGETLNCNESPADLFRVDADFELQLEVLTSDLSCDTIEINANLAQGVNPIGFDDPFPEEYRPDVLFDSVYFDLPDGLIFIPGSAEVVYETREGNSQSGPRIIVSQPLPDPLIIPGAGITTIAFEQPDDFPVVDMLGELTDNRLRFKVFPECMDPDGFSFDASFNLTRYNYTLGFQSTLTRELTYDLNYQIGERTLEVADPSYEGFSDTATWVLEYCNTAVAGTLPLGIPNNFIVLDLPNNDVQPQELLDISDPNNPIAYPLLPYGTGNSYWAQIGTLPGNNCRVFQLNATYSNCDLIEFPIIYDFNCGGYPPDPDQITADCSPTGIEQTLRILPNEASLQVNLTQSPTGLIELCTPLDYSLTIINTLLGNAFDVEVGIELPVAAGLFIEPGSCSVQYGAGPVVPIPDPVQIMGTNQYVWDMSVLLPALLDAGLPGVNQPEPSSFIVNFQLGTDCNYINKSIFSYWTNWRNACESLGTTPTFFSPPFQVIGVPTSFNEYIINVQGAPLVNCGGETTYEFSFFNLGDSITNALELIRLIVDPALDVVPGSFQNISNYPGGGDPLSYIVGNERWIEWPMPPGVGIGQFITFEAGLAVMDWDSLYCAETEIAVQVLRQAQVGCQTAPSGFCDLDILEEEAFFNLDVEAASWEVSILNGSSVPLNGMEEEVTFDFTIEHLGGSEGAGIIEVEIFADLDGDQSFDPANDIWLGSTPLDIEGALPGTILQEQLSLLVPTIYSCSGYLAVISLDTNVCTCAASEDYLPYVPLFNAGQADSLCYGESLILGTPEVLGYQYVWSPDTYLDDPNAAQPQFLYTGPSNPSNPITETLVLETTRIGGCISYDTLSIIIISLDALPQATTNYNGFEISCPGADDGGISVIVDGGLSPFDFAWEDGQTGQILTDLEPGMYEVTVTDSLGCMSTGTINLNEPPPLQNTLTAIDYSGFGVSCFGSMDGSLEAFPSGGVGGYSFLWTGGAVANPLTGLSAGSYQLTITDANGCELLDSMVLNEPDLLELSAASDPIICEDEDNGVISLSASGGVGPYLYDGNSFADNYSITGLDDPGLYNLMITDANDCPASTTVVLEEWFSIFSLGAEPIICPAGDEGAICITSLSGFAPYSYEWSVPGVDSCLQGLISGQYSLTVTDALGCIYTFDTTLVEPEVFDISFTTEDVSCFDGSDGSITVVASGGEPPYSFDWDGGLIGNPISSLAAGAYGFTLTDAQGCMWSDIVLLDEPPLLVLQLNGQDVTCNEGEDGQIQAIPDGGTPPYAYFWSTGSNNSFIEDVPAGFYELTVQDAEGCMVDGQLELTQPPFPALDLYAIDASCYGYNDGLIGIDFPVGTGYSYSLDGISFQAATEFPGLGVGAYDVYLQDPEGCIYPYETVINEPPEQLVYTSPDTSIYLGESTQLFAYGYSGVISYQWDPPLTLDCFDCTDPVSTPFETTTYTVSVATAEGCLDDARVTVQVLLEDDIYIPNAFSPNLDGYNEHFLLFAGPSVAQVDYLRIFDRWGGLVFQEDDFQPNDPAYGWDGRVDGKAADPGVFVYVLQVSYLDGRQKIFKGDITLIR